MNVLESPEALAALARIGHALSDVGAGLVDFVAVAEQRLRKQERREAPLGIEQEREVRLLWSRIGRENRKFLYDLATEFRPGDTFTLKEAADDLGMTKGSARARMMNLGRTMKSLAGDAPVLWDVQWDSYDGENSYDWDFDAHRAILKVVEG